MTVQDHLWYLIFIPLGILFCLSVSTWLSVTSLESKIGAAVRAPLCFRVESSTAGYWAASGPTFVT